MDQQCAEKLQRLADTITYWVALVMSVYHIVASQYSIFGSEQHINLHILFALVIVFLQAMKFATKKDRVISGLLLALIAVTVVTMVYIHQNATRFQFAIGKQPFDKVLTGIIVILVMLIATRIRWGRVIPVIAVIALLVVLMIQGYSTAKALFFSTILLVALGFIWQFRMKETHPLRTFCKKFLDGLAGGGKSVAGIAIVCSCTGILVEILNATGLPSKMSQMALQVAGDHLFPLAVMVAITCLVFGMGMPSGPAYILAALLGAPALTGLGVPLIVAHFFVFYFAEMSALTPPVAIGCLVASGLAKSSFLRTCLESLKIGIAGFVLPFLFLYRPALLLQGTGLELVWAFVMIAAFLLTFIIACEGFFMARLAMPERLLFGVAAACFLLPVVWLDLVGLALFLLLTVRHALSMGKGGPAASG